MAYSFLELLLSVSLAVYVAVCIMTGVVRWSHKCAPYDKHADYYYPGWRTLALGSLSNLVLLPAVFLPGDPDAILQIRMMLILSSPFLCSALIFSYFGRVLKVSWWRKPIYVLSGTYSLMSLIALVCTLMPGTQMQGAFLRGYFVAGGFLALVYLLGLVLALRLIIQRLGRFSEESFSDPDDFPAEYAKSLIYIPFLHLVMSWSTTFNGNIVALSFGLFMLSDVHAPETDLAALGREEGEQGMERGGLAGTISTDETGDFSLLQGEGDVIQGETGIALDQIPQLQNGAHSFPSFICCM